MNEIIRKMVKENARRRMRVSRVYAEPQLAGAEDEERAGNDFAYWAATRGRIKNKHGGDDIPFRLNYAQQRLVDTLEKMRREDRPIRLILLKARQWGGRHNIIYSYI